MEDSKPLNDEDGEGQSENGPLTPDATQFAADAVAEIMVEADLRVEVDEAITVAKEILEKFSSPLMIQRADGATASVSITASPAGGVDGGNP